MDFDHDGRRHVWNSVPDVLASIANYLHHFHWTFKAPVYADIGYELKAPALLRLIKRAVRAWYPGNRCKNSNRYVMAVSELAQHLTAPQVKSGGNQSA